MFLRQDNQAGRACCGGPERSGVQHDPDAKSGIEQSRCDLMRTVGAFAVQFHRGRKEARVSPDDAHKDASAARLPPKMLFDLAAAQRMSKNDGSRTRQRTARRNGIEEKMAAGIQIARDAAESFAKIRLAKEVVDRVKVCGNQIHRTRQAETPNVLLQQADRSTWADPLCYAKHVR